MKKIMHYISILVIASLVLVGCSYGYKNSNNSSKTENMNVLNNLTLIYTIPEDNVVLERYDNIDSVVSKFFSDESNNGFIAEIVPVEYVFYYTIDEDEDTGKLYLDGYAECRCSVQKISQKFNLSKNSAEEINIRQNVFLEPINEEAAIEMLESIGAYKNDICIEGTYKVPSKFINEADYRLIMSDPSLMLLGDKPYYSLITFEDDIAYLYMVSDGLNENRGDVPDDIKASVNSFQEFLTINDPNLLNQDK